MIIVRLLPICLFILCVLCSLIVWKNIEDKITLSNSGIISTNDFFSSRNIEHNSIDYVHHQSTMKKIPNYPAITLKKMDIPLLIFTSQRPDYLNLTLSTVWDYHPYNTLDYYINSTTNTYSVIVGSPIIVSQDGTNSEVTSIIQNFKKKFISIGIPFFHIIHRNRNSNPMQRLKGHAAYVAISNHYGWALTQVFTGKVYFSDSKIKIKKNLLPLPKQVIILEEDIKISIDFFLYMSSLSTLLVTDPSLLAVSAFNDNGKEGSVSNPKRLLRSDFFPGLGWMITYKTWQDLQPWAPNGYWDDWLREPEQRKKRHVIRPEVSRTYHFGSHDGASENQYGSHLESIQLNDVLINWDTEDLSYLKNSTFYCTYMVMVKESKIVDDLIGAFEHLRNENVQLKYESLIHFTDLASSLNLMGDIRAGIPRTAYMGIVETRPYGKGGNILFLTPVNYYTL